MLRNPVVIDNTCLLFRVAKFYFSQRPWITIKGKLNDVVLLHRVFLEELPDYLAGVEFPGCLANHEFGQVL